MKHPGQAIQIFPNCWAPWSGAARFVAGVYQLLGSAVRMQSLCARLKLCSALGVLHYPKQNQPTTVCSHSWRPAGDFSLPACLQYLFITWMCQNPGRQTWEGLYKGSILYSPKGSRVGMGYGAGGDARTPSLFEFKKAQVWSVQWAPCRECKLGRAVRMSGQDALKIYHLLQNKSQSFPLTSHPQGSAL